MFEQSDRHVEGSGSRIVASSHFLTAGTEGGNRTGCGFRSSSTQHFAAAKDRGRNWGSFATDGDAVGWLHVQQWRCQHGQSEQSEPEPGPAEPEPEPEVSSRAAGRSPASSRFKPEARPAGSAEPEGRTLVCRMSLVPGSGPEPSDRRGYPAGRRDFSLGRADPLWLSTAPAAPLRLRNGLNCRSRLSGVSSADAAPDGAALAGA